MEAMSLLSKTCSRKTKIALVFVVCGAMFAVQASAWRAPEVGASEVGPVVEKVVGAPADLVEAAKLIALSYDEHGEVELPAWATADKPFSDRILAKKTLITNRIEGMGIQIANLKRDVAVVSQKIDGNSGVVTVKISTTYGYRGDSTPVSGAGRSTVTLSRTESGGYRVDWVTSDDPYDQYMDVGQPAETRAAALRGEVDYSKMINDELKVIAKERSAVKQPAVAVEPEAQNILDQDKMRTYQQQYYQNYNTAWPDFSGIVGG